MLRQLTGAIYMKLNKVARLEMVCNRAIARGNKPSSTGRPAPGAQVGYIPTNLYPPTYTLYTRPYIMFGTPPGEPRAKVSLCAKVTRAMSAHQDSAYSATRKWNTRNAKASHANRSQTSSQGSTSAPCVATQSTRTSVLRAVDIRPCRI